VNSYRSVCNWDQSPSRYPFGLKFGSSLMTYWLLSSNYLLQQFELRWQPCAPGEIRTPELLVRSWPKRT
jgi:hypothetical protein